MSIMHGNTDNLDEFATSRNEEAETSNSNITLITSSHSRTGSSKKKTSLRKKITKKAHAAYVNLVLEHRLVKLVQLAAVLYICVYTFCFEREPDSIDAKKGFIITNGTERPLVAITPFQQACFLLAKISAWYMYPPLVVVFVSKFRATGSFVAHTPISMYLPTNLHQLHVYCGSAVFYASLIHTVCHIMRWFAQEHIELLFNNRSGLSGCVVVVALLLICIPMMIRTSLKYELRKALHYFFLIFLIAMCFHAPMSSLPYSGYCTLVFTCLLVWYIIDVSYCTCFMTEKIQSTKFEVLSSGLQVTMRVSDAFKKRTQGTYAYVCLPWVEKNEWHAFSVFENPENEQECQIFMTAIGDWTKKTHGILQRDTQRPAWIQGPFPSPFNNADSYDNMILVASGIGITPALSVIQSQYQFKKINLIWMVQDIELLRFFLKRARFDDDGWNLIFYTGKESLDQSSLDIIASADICIICGRPELPQLIPNLVYCLESKRGLPEEYFSREDIEAVEHVNKSTIVGCNEETKKFINASSLRRSSVTIDKEQLQGIDYDVPWNFIHEAEGYVTDLCSDTILSNWGVMYCGGSKQIKEVVERCDKQV